MVGVPQKQWPSVGVSVRHARIDKQENQVLHDASMWSWLVSLTGGFVAWVFRQKARLDRIEEVAIDLREDFDNRTRTGDGLIREFYVMQAEIKNDRARMEQ